jgi:hypothetical protein
MKNRPIPLWLLAATLFEVPLVLLPPLAASDVTPKLLVVVGGASAVWLALAIDALVDSAKAKGKRETSVPPFCLLPFASCLRLPARQP